MCVCTCVHTQACTTWHSWCETESQLCKQPPNQLSIAPAQHVYKKHAQLSAILLCISFTATMDGVCKVNKKLSVNRWAMQILIRIDSLSRIMWVLNSNRLKFEIGLQLCQTEMVIQTTREFRKTLKRIIKPQSYRKIVYVLQKYYLNRNTITYCYKTYYYTSLHIKASLNPNNRKANYILYLVGYMFKKKCKTWITDPICKFFEAVTNINKSIMLKNEQQNGPDLTVCERYR